MALEVPPPATTSSPSTMAASTTPVKSDPAIVAAVTADDAVSRVSIDIPKEGGANGGGIGVGDDDDDDDGDDHDDPPPWHPNPSPAMSPCVHPPDLGPVEAFVASAVSDRTARMSSDRSTVRNAEDDEERLATSKRSYRAIVDSIRRPGDDPRTVARVLIALRTSGNGYTLNYLAAVGGGGGGGSTTSATIGVVVHAELIHWIFKLDPFEVPRGLRGESEEAIRGRDGAIAAVEAAVAAVAATAEADDAAKDGVKNGRRSPASASRRRSLKAAVAAKEAAEKNLRLANERVESTSERRRPFESYEMADAHFHLLVALVSANAAFLHPAMEALWRLGAARLCDAPAERMNRIHGTLSRILDIVPKGKSHVPALLASNYPFKTRPIDHQTWYARQCLCVLRYVPNVHYPMLELFIDKALEMDVEIRVSAGGSVRLEKEEDTEEKDCKEGVFEMDLGETTTTTTDGKERDVSKDDGKEPTNASNPEADEVDEMADKLDSLMLIVFRHLAAATRRQGGSASARRLYVMVSRIFESTILTTHRSKFVQFVVFLLCGLDDDAARNSASAVGRDGDQDLVDVSMDISHPRPPPPQPRHGRLYREFAAKLVDAFLDPYRSTVSRQSAACYLASFVSRASYVCPETACESTSALLRWAEAYLSSVGGVVRARRNADRSNDRRSHSLFYTACQGAFYVMCFRGAEAVRYRREALRYHADPGREEEEDDGASYADPTDVDVGRERWEAVCSHPLDPLRHCLESVRKEFLHVADFFDLLGADLLGRLLEDDARISSSTAARTRTASRRRSGGPARAAAPIRTAATETILARRRTTGGVGGLGRGLNPLDSFFPFDPYLLRRSHAYVDPYYRHWGGSADAPEEEDDVVMGEERRASVVCRSDGSDDEDGSDESSDSDSSETDGGDDRQQRMPDMAESQGSRAMSCASSVGGSGLMTTTPDDEGASTKPLSRRDLWARELHRARAQSVGSGSW